MEVTDTLPATLPPSMRSTSPPAPRSSPRRGPASPKRPLVDSRWKRTSPKPSTAAGKDALSTKTTSKSTRTANASTRPLVPVTERRSHENKGVPRPRGDTETEKWEVAPDGGSAGREGRQFTVAKVGNNGRIYLRPSVRPAHQRYPQPNFSFPVTPPSTAGLETLSQVRSGAEAESDLHQSQWTPTSRPSPRGERILDPGALHQSKPPTRHRRALSDSTIREDTGINESDAGAFKVVISKPGGESKQRPRTTEDIDPPSSLPHLDITIPSWRIGVPRFTSTGTPLIRGSSYAPSFAQSDDLQSIGGSIFDRAQKDFDAPLPSLGPRRPSTLRVPQSRHSRSTYRRSHGLMSPRTTPHPLRSTFMSTHPIIDASMFDDLTFKPACDDRSIVRYAPATGAVTAATPPRLVAEITSPCFLDYELISDFFLTFRAFLEPENLLRMLIARLRWAVARNDEIGMIVHVRVFVALRHWILNYFVDDFVVDYNLREEFCKLLNDLVDELSQEGQARKIQLKILNELKKCWRRVCAHYWDGPDFDETADPKAVIVPGGIAGDRDPSLSPTFWEREDAAGPPQLNSLFPVPETSATSFYAEPPRAEPRPGDPRAANNRPKTPENQKANTGDRELGPWSPGSLASLDVVSCSFPSKQMRNLHPNISHPLAAHPVSPNSTYNQTGPVATTPRTLVGKRVRPNPRNQGSSGFPESPEQRESEKSPSKDHERVSAAPPAGSLVRGDILPPGKAFVEVRSSDQMRQTTIFENEDDRMHRQDGPADAMSGRGMRRLIGSVRRALSTRQYVTNTQTLINNVEVGTGSATTTRLPGTAVVPQKPSSRDGALPPVRIDILGAGVAEDFTRAVREDAGAESQQRGFPGPQGLQSPPIQETDAEYSEAHMDGTAFGHLLLKQRPRPTSDAALTGGSKSIVIVDDTVPVTALSGPPTHLPTANPSVEAFADALMPGGADMTPPMTPPVTHGERARRSSYLLNENMRTAMSPEPLPPFVPDLATLEGRSTAPPSEGGGCISRPTTHRTHRRPPVSGSLTKMHRRNRSTRTHRSMNSIMLRRNSYNSELAPPSTVRSFDATSFTRYSADYDKPDVPIPAPLRVLRRRPGGDLRAATNVDELDHHRLRRSHSLGSLATFTESMRSTGIYSRRPASAEDLDAVVSGDYQNRLEAFSVGQLADKPRKRELSLCSTRSSKPVMRPSFEAEAKKLAQIPDDEDDGGVESALLKLEGKFDKRVPRLSMDLQDRGDPEPSEECDSELTSVPTSVIAGDGVSHQRTKEQQHRQSRVDDDACSAETDTDRRPITSASAGHLDVPRASTPGQQSFLSDASRESYSSIPLLDRGLTDDGQSRRETRNWTDRSILLHGDDGSTGPATEQRLSFDFIQKTDSMVNDTQVDERVPSSVEEHSFLDSDLSSELSADGAQTDLPEHARTSAPRDALPAHPLGGTDMVSASSLPSPPHTHDLDRDTQACAGKNRRHSDKADLQSKPLPPTPEGTPAAHVGEPRSPFDPVGTTQRPAEPDSHEMDTSRQYSVHLPFILAFDSETLAQQFTLIEKDALNEIDWKELVDMDWRNATNHDSRSWVDFLRNTDARGVEVVIARFNLVVKWSISEIVLTQHIEERARCIIKFIHIAAHCRRYRNFATLAQLTIALSSNEVSRLARTWELVPPKDMKTLRELETLVTPMRNFFNLRAEMESGPDAGCIPFVGIYTHDLLYSAQRPSEIASSPTTAPLVNFERCRIGAGVVKTLLRLLEASSRYNFQPVEGITERCLWIGALSDDEIRRLSGNLE